MNALPSSATSASGQPSGGGGALGPKTDAAPVHAARVRLEELQRLTSALVRLSTFEEIGEFCSRELAELAGASMCWIGGVTESGVSLESIGAYGVSDETAHRFSHLPIDASYAIGDAVLSGRPL